MLISRNRFKQAMEIAILIDKPDDLLDKAIMETYFKTRTANIGTNIILKLKMVCDFHGHSKRKNVFIYGCENGPGENENLEKVSLDFLT
jgi:hypothetical protein